MSSVSVIIPHYYKERERNLLQITDALYRGTVRPDEIIIWNNDSPFDPMFIQGMMVDVIQSHRNVGCQGRFIAALTARSDYVIFQDNDVMVQQNTIENLLRWSYFGGVITLDGRTVSPGEGYKKSVLYTTGPEMKAPIKVDMSLGHMEMVGRKLLYSILSNFPFDETTEMEDLYFSAACKLLGVPIHVVPSNHGAGLVALSMGGVGSCLTDGHYDKRDAICKEIFT